MFFFSKNYNNSINQDFLKKTNLINYQQIKSKKGDVLNLSFSNFKVKKQQKTKLKNLFALEVLSLQKSLFKFVLNKGKRKKIYLPFEAQAPLRNKFLIYFYFNFSKLALGYIKNIQDFTADIEMKKIEVESATSFYIFIRNPSYFHDLNEIGLQAQNTLFLVRKPFHILQKLSFYKIIL